MTVSPFLAGLPWPSTSASSLMPDLIFIAPLMPGKDFFESRLFPLRPIADDNFAAGEDPRIGAAAPTGVHRVLQPRQNLVHPLARFGFAANQQPGRADVKNLAACIGEPNAAYQ